MIRISDVIGKVNNNDDKPTRLFNLKTLAFIFFAKN